jgi:hypothetical protein
VSLIALKNKTQTNFISSLQMCSLFGIEGINDETHGENIGMSSRNNSRLKGLTEERNSPKSNSDIGAKYEELEAENVSLKERISELENANRRLIKVCYVALILP